MRQCPCCSRWAAVAAAGFVALALWIAPARVSGTTTVPRESAPAQVVPAPPDSVSIESAPVPLLVPGQPGPADSTLRSPEERAREQFALGAQLERDGQPLAAFFAYRNAARLNPKLPEANYRQGMILVRTAPADAVTLFARELKLNPKHRDAGRELGVALSRAGRHREAIAGLEGLTRRGPGRDDNWYALGVAYLAAERHVAAEAAFRRALRLGPARAAEHRDLGVTLAALGRASAARAEYRRALSLAPCDAGTWLNLGNLDRRAGRADSALASYRAAERCDSTTSLAYAAEVQVLTEQGRGAEVGEAYRRWVRAQPDDMGLRLTAVRHFASLERRDVALEIARDGVRRDSRSAAAHQILGMALQSQGEYRAALRELRLAERLYRAEPDRERVRQLIATTRADAPDSLRALFVADSIANVGAGK